MNLKFGSNGNQICFKKRQRRDDVLQTDSSNGADFT